MNIVRGAQIVGIEKTRHIHDINATVTHVYDNAKASNRCVETNQPCSLHAMAQQRIDSTALVMLLQCAMCIKPYKSALSLHLLALFSHPLDAYDIYVIINATDQRHTQHTKIASTFRG